MNEALADNLLSLVIIGWALAVFGISQWLVERRLRVFFQNQATFGGTPLKKARVFAQPDAEDHLEETIDRIQGIAGEKRRATPEDAKFTAETLQNGIDWLLQEAQDNGRSLSVGEAADEAMRMLNAEGTEM